MTDDEAMMRLKELTEQLLPRRAISQCWPIRFDHCFKRICFDAGFGDAWFRHIARPAERHLRGEPLHHALHCAEELLAGDRELLEKRNRASLRWRGKLQPARATRNERQIPASPQ